MKNFILQLTILQREFGMDVNGDKGSEAYQEWFKKLLTAQELSKKLSEIFKKQVSIRSIARERKAGLSVSAIVRGRPMYDLPAVLGYFKAMADKENSSKKGVRFEEIDNRS